MPDQARKLPRITYEVYGLLTDSKAMNIPALEAESQEDVLEAEVLVNGIGLTGYQMLLWPRRDRLLLQQFATYYRCCLCRVGYPFEFCLLWCIRASTSTSTLLCMVPVGQKLLVWPALEPRCAFCVCSLLDFYRTTYQPSNFNF